MLFIRAYAWQRLLHPSVQPAPLPCVQTLFMLLKKLPQVYDWQYFVMSQTWDEIWKGFGGRRSVFCFFLSLWYENSEYWKKLFFHNCTHCPPILCSAPLRTADNNSVVMAWSSYSSHLGFLTRSDVSCVHNKSPRDIRPAGGEAVSDNQMPRWLSPTEKTEEVTDLGSISFL